MTPWTSTNARIQFARARPRRGLGERVQVVVDVAEHFLNRLVFLIDAERRLARGDQELTAVVFERVELRSGHHQNLLAAR
jgi:hypothetical protein